MQIEDQPKIGASANKCPVTGIGREFNPIAYPYLAEPYSFWLRARKEDPVFYSPELDYWVVTRYEDIKAIFADPAAFSASVAQTPVQPLAPEVLQLLKDGGFRARPTMSNADPPAHTRVRKCAWQA